jgi:hypothetical protein
LRRKLYTSIEQVQIDVDQWIETYNHERTHSGKYCYGKTPIETFSASKHRTTRRTSAEGLSLNQNIGFLGAYILSAASAATKKTNFFLRAIPHIRA